MINKSRDQCEDEFRKQLDQYLIDPCGVSEEKDNIYHEEIQFSHSDEISQKFSELEASNLFLIHQRQEVEQAYEELKNDYVKIVNDLTKKKNEYKTTLAKLENDQKASEDSQRRTRFSTQAEAKYASQNEEENVSIDDLLHKIRSALVMTPFKKGSVNLVDQLVEMEKGIDSKIETLNSYRVDRETEVRRIEKAFQTKRKELRLKDKEKAASDNMERIRRAAIEKEEKKRSTPPRPTKISMERSQKRALKKKVVKKVINEDELMYLRYIGDI